MNEDGGRKSNRPRSGTSKVPSTARLPRATPPSSSSSTSRRPRRPRSARLGNKETRPRPPATLKAAPAAANDGDQFYDKHGWRKAKADEIDPRHVTASYSNGFDKRIAKAHSLAKREKKKRQHARQKAILDNRQAAYNRSSALVDGLQAQLEEVRRLRAMHGKKKKDHIPEVLPISALGYEAPST